MKKISLVPIVNSFKNADTITFKNNEKLFILKDVFDLETLKSFHQLRHSKQGTTVPLQENNARISWDIDPLQNECFDTDDFSFFVEFLNTVQNRNHYQFCTASVWEDSEGYQIGTHVDNSTFVSAMQIYLPVFDENMEPKDSEQLYHTGTKFYQNEELVCQVPFVPNTGYFLTNSQTVFHSSGDAVSADNVRRSLYMIFK